MYTFKVISYEYLKEYEELIIDKINFIKSKKPLWIMCNDLTVKKPFIIKLLKKERLLPKKMHYKSFRVVQYDDEGKVFLIENNSKNIPLFLIEEIEEREVF